MLKGLETGEPNSTVSRIRGSLVLAAVFLVSFSCANLIAGHISLPFSNPLGIVGPLTGIRYNPTNNVVRFLVITLLPTVALSVIFVLGSGDFAQKLFRPRSNELPNDGRLTGYRQTALLAALILTTALVALNTQSYMSVGGLETYEEGLVLGAGMSYLDGGVPYRDFAVYHGLYDEPLRVAVAFKVFGHSIGAVRTVQSINKIVAFGFLAWLLLQLFRWNFVHVFLVIFAFHWLAPQGKYILMNKAGIAFLHPVIVMSRDIALFAFLAILAFFAERIRRGNAKPARVFLVAAIWSAVPILGAIHSLERGVYLMAAFILVAPALYLLFFRGAPAGRPFVAGCAVGLLLSAVLLTVLIRGEFRELGRLMALLSSDALQLQFSSPYPFISPYPYMRTLYLIIDLMLAFNCFWVVKTFFIYWRSTGAFMTGARAFLEAHFMEAALLVVSMLYFRNGLGRADWIHVAYCLPAAMILFFLIIVRHVIAPLLRTIPKLKRSFVVVFWILAAAQVGVLLASVPRYDLLRENFPLAKADLSYLPERWKALVPFLRENLSSGENFYSLSDELSLYYFVGKACPVRFSLLDMIVRDERYQREVVADLQNNNVKYVVLDPNTVYFHLDGYSNELRAPLVFEYVRSHYQQDRIIDGQQILIRMSHPVRQ